MTDTLIAELREAAKDRQHLGTNALRFSRAADALEAQDAKITEALAEIEKVRRATFEGYWVDTVQAFQDIKRILSADAPTEPVQGDAKLLQNSDARPAPHEHKGERKVWCETHQHEHIASIPRFTYLCKDCGWGRWYGDQAREHEYWTQENLREAHVTYEVEHVTRPLDAPTVPTPELEREDDAPNGVAGHDEQCEAEYLAEATGWLPCGCADRATEDVRDVLAKRIDAALQSLTDSANAHVPVADAILARFNVTRKGDHREHG